MPLFLQLISVRKNPLEKENTIFYTPKRDRIYISTRIFFKSLQSCLTLCDPTDSSPPGSPVPGILQAKNTGVGCHFLLQCMKVKSESEVTQSWLTLSDPMNCSLPCSSIHGIFQARVLEWGAIIFSKVLEYNMPKINKRIIKHKYLCKMIRKSWVAI